MGDCMTEPNIDDLMAEAMAEYGPCSGDDAWWRCRHCGHVQPVTTTGVSVGICAECKRLAPQVAERIDKGE